VSVRTIAGQQDLSVQLAARMVVLAGRADSARAGRPDLDTYVALDERERAGSRSAGERERHGEAGHDDGEPAHHERVSSRASRA